MLRKCSVCGKEYPATLEYFQKQKDVKSGLTRRCKNCLHEARRKQRANHIRTEQEKANARKYNKKYSKRNRKIIREKQKERRKRIKDKFNLDDSSVHRYIAKIKKKPEICTICNQSDALELACINHHYSRNPNDYLWLCNSCHQIFDHCREGIIIEH